VLLPVASAPGSVILLGTKSRLWQPAFEVNRTVREHIEKLQTHLNALNAALMSGRKTPAERNEIESEIRAATMALEHFHAALLAEQNLSKKK
jgi:hypothetical protein